MFELYSRGLEVQRAGDLISAPELLSFLQTRRCCQISIELSSQRNFLGVDPVPLCAKHQHCPDAQPPVGPGKDRKGHWLVLGIDVWVSCMGAVRRAVLVSCSSVLGCSPCQSLGLSGIGRVKSVLRMPRSVQWKASLPPGLPAPYCCSGHW